MTEFNKQLQHLIALAQTPGFKEYAWHRAKQLDADSSRLWVGIADALKAEMQRRALSKSRELNGA